MKSDLKSWFAHAGITVLAGVIGLVAFGSLIVGLTLGVGFYLGREVAQHERKERGSNPLRGFYVWNWSLDAKMDLLFPLISSVLLVLLVNYI
jgi:hypothetical protein